MQLTDIDGGQTFDFGRISDDYGRYRDIYPVSMYEKLVSLGIGRKGQQILDLGSGTAVLPVNLAHTGAQFTATDISENQIRCGKQIVQERQIPGIRFRVCSAEATGFEDDSFDIVTAAQCFQYFQPEKAAQEIRRVLKPHGLFCKIFMDWLPQEDPLIGEMERLVLRYNPAWSGYGFDHYRYCYPEWAEGRFDIDTIHSYRTYLQFSKENWIGRVRSCRGIGASLSPETAAAFEKEYRQLLEAYTEPLQLLHEIHIELYRAI